MAPPILGIGYIRVVFRRNAVEVKDVEEIVKLSVNITTHCEPVALIEKGRERQRE